MPSGHFSSGSFHHQGLRLPQWVDLERLSEQMTVAEEILEHYAAGVPVVILSAPTGCLAKGTLVSINRASGNNGGGITKHYPIEEVVSKFNGGARLTPGRGASRTWNLSQPTRVRTMTDDGKLRLRELVAAIPSGRKPVFSVVTRSGRTIRATAEHPFFVFNDDWYVLDDLSPGRLLAAAPTRRKSEGKRAWGPKPWYELVHGLEAHPYADSLGRVPHHRLIVEADVNDVETELLVLRLKHGELAGLEFLNPAEWSVHHKDGNHRNNEQSNLEVMSQSDHAKRHGLEGKWRNVVPGVEPDEIVSITPDGEDETYDLKVDAPNNFVANGLVVHNCGKTIIAEIVRQRLASMGWETRQPGRHKTVYTCVDKELQRQVARDFPWAKILMGKENYRTQNHPDVTCDLCTRTPDDGCRFCDTFIDCPYQISKRTFALADLGSTNLAYLLREANSGRRSVTGKRDFIILDEADEVENWLRSTIEIVVSAWMRRRLGIGVPRRKTVSDAWQQWIENDLAPSLAIRISELEGDTNPRTMKERNGLIRLLDQLDEIDVGENWVYDGYQGYQDGKHPVIFRPIMVDRYGPTMLWRHAPRFLLMSATIISPARMAEDLGLEEHEWASVTMDSPFDPARSPIQVRPVADMSRKADERQPLLDELHKIVEAHPGQRILVHTHSYDLTAWLRRYLTSPRVLSYDSAKGKGDALGEYRRRGDAVMLAPSLARGVSFDDDLARVNIAAKLPRPSIGDKRVLARLYSRGGDEWYACETIKALAQSLGRSTRSKSDWSKGIILDRQFVSSTWRRHKHLLPVWFKKRLDMTGRKEPVRE